MQPTRRDFLRGLAILIGAGAAEPVAKIVVPEPRHKLWVVGARLEGISRRVVFPLFEIAPLTEISLVHVFQQHFAGKIQASEDERLLRILSELPKGLGLGAS